MFITKETKWHLLCSFHDNSFVAGPILIRTEIPSFYLNQGSLIPANLMMGVKQDPLSYFKGFKMNEDIWFLTDRNWTIVSFHGNITMDVIWFLLWWTVHSSVFWKAFKKWPSMGWVDARTPSILFYCTSIDFCQICVLKDITCS